MYSYKVQFSSNDPVMEFIGVNPLVDYLNKQMRINFYTKDKIYNYFTNRGSSALVKNLHLLERTRIVR